MTTMKIPAAADSSKCVNRPQAPTTPPYIYVRTHAFMKNPKVFGGRGHNFKHDRISRPVSLLFRTSKNFGFCHWDSKR